MSATTPAAAWQRMLDGNQRFVDDQNRAIFQDRATRAALKDGQSPFALVFGCSDSRVAAEIIFDQGLGELFVVRNAGQVVDDAVLGSIEFGVQVLGIPLVVVLGHDSCGAVTATKNSLESGVLPGGFQRNFIEDILPSALSSQLPENPTVNDMVQEHTRFTCERIIEQSRVISEAVAANQTAVVGMFYHLAEGSTEIVWSTDNIK